MTTPVRPLRERRQVSLSMGAMRWLLGAESRVVGATGAVRNSAIVRWRYLIARIPNTEEWAEYLAEFWAEHRHDVLAWHAARGYDVPQLHLGHERERAFLRQQREQRHARI
jgi:hypothetical protein